MATDQQIGLAVVVHIDELKVKGAANLRDGVSG